MTGAGAYNLKIRDGDSGPLVPIVPPLSIPVLGISVKIWSPLVSPGLPGQQAQVLFAGQAPGLVAGVVQLNLRVPENAQTGKAGIIVYVGDYATGYLQGVIQIR